MMREEKIEKLNKAKEMLITYINIIDDISNGVPETKACASRDINPSKFRHCVKVLSEIEPYIYLDELKTDIWVCPQEQMVLDAGLFEKLEDMPMDVVENVDSIMNNVFDTRSKHIMHDIYFEGMSLSECADKYSVTLERIRQIKNKALRSLRARHSLIRNGKASKTKVLEERANKEKDKILAETSALVSAEKDRDLVKKMKDTITEMIGEDKAKKIIEANPEVITLDYIVKEHGGKMSVRLYNVLNRSINGIYADRFYKVSIHDLTITDFMRMRNMGRKSLEELIDILSEYGWKND